MVPELRKKFNETFTDERYEAFLEELNTAFGFKLAFRVAETPIFVPKYLKHKMLDACAEIIRVIKRPDFKQMTEKAIPPQWKVPNETDHTHFLAIDFAVCQDADGSFSPRLIEMQGFPSLFAYQDFVSLLTKKYWEIPDNYDYLFSGLGVEGYRQLMRNAIVGSCEPKEVVLLELDPEKQGTRIDFACTEDLLGVPTVNLRDVIKEGKQLFRMENGEKIRIKRIYNRVIFDELEGAEADAMPFSFTEDLDVEWAGHPNWFYRISKYTLPYLDSRYVPRTRFLNEFESWPADLENYVLKPLFSFAGKGVVFDVKLEDLEEIPVDKRGEWILMEKVKYAHAFDSPDGPVKAEIRMLFLWPDGDDLPTLGTTLVRLSKGVMMGVKFNKNHTWVGGSVAFFERD